MRAGFWEILLIVVLVLILFGHSKIPELAKNIANGINVFKKELKGEDKKKENKKEAEKSTKPATTPAVKPKPKKAVKKK